MSMLERLRGKVPGGKHAEGGARSGGNTGPNVGDSGPTVGDSQGGTPVPPELPLDDDGNDARNIGG